MRFIAQTARDLAPPRLADESSAPSPPAARQNATEPNPIRGIWYASAGEPFSGSPCYGCRRGLRRAFTMSPLSDDGAIDYHHLVREGVTIDCEGTTWLIERWCAENPELVLRSGEPSGEVLSCS